jgi:hypothetical protein
LAVLTNITLAIANIVAIRPDILTSFQYEDESDDFADEITRAKQTLYRQVKDHEREMNPSLTEAELATLLVSVKDHADTLYLQERLALLVISEIFKANDMMETSRAYADDAKKVSMVYYIDEDADSVAEASELRETSGVKLGR